MQKRHIVPLVILAFVIVVGGILLIIGTQESKDTGTVTNKPNGSAPVRTLPTP